MAKEISCIIPNYNGEKIIRKCINSILASDKRKNLIKEIIVVDDKSNDNSVDIIKKNYPFVKIISNSKNKGASYSRNIGIKRSRGKYILFLDNDIAIQENFFEKISKYLGKYDIIYPKIIFEDATVMIPKTEEEKKFLKISPVFIIKKDSLKKLDELFDEAYIIYVEDTDFFLRCLAFGLKQKLVEDTSAVHRTKPSIKNLRRYYLESRNKMYALIKLSPIPKRAKKEFNFPNLKSVLVLLIVGIMNKNILEGKIVKSCKGFLTNLFKSKEKITNSRFTLIFLFIKALAWNLANAKKTLSKRRKLKKFLCDNKILRF